MILLTKNDKNVLAILDLTLKKNGKKEDKISFFALSDKIVENLILHEIWQLKFFFLSNIIFNA